MAGVLCVDTVYSCCTRRFQLLRLWIDEIPEVLFTIQCNTKHHPSVVLLIMLYEVVLTFEWMKSSDAKFTAQSVVLFTLLYKCFQSFRLWLQFWKFCHNTLQHDAKLKRKIKTGCTLLTGLLQVVKNSGSEMGSLKYDRTILERSPFGGSFVILTPFCSTDTGKFGDG